jgi:hypothetical protein
MDRTHWPTVCSNVLTDVNVQLTRVGELQQLLLTVILEPYFATHASACKPLASLNLVMPTARQLFT